jgi:glycosyltransferase involved in cell wall biosynthesis
MMRFLDVAMGGGCDMSIASDAVHQFSPERGPLSSFPAYPVDILSYHALEQCTLDKAGVPYIPHPPEYAPVMIAHYALSQWNLYLANGNEQHLKAFMAQVKWFIEQMIRIGNNACGWPISAPRPERHMREFCLSAQAQGCAISVLIRAFHLTQNQLFLTVARYAVRPFLLDILDGGVCAPLGTDGLFFEDIAVYPAHHNLTGCLFALIGLYDYVTMMPDTAVKQRIDECVLALRKVLTLFDAGFWTYTSVLERHLTAPEHISLQIQLLETLARYAASPELSKMAVRWRKYRDQLWSRLCYQVVFRWSSLLHGSIRLLRQNIFPPAISSQRIRACLLPAKFSLVRGVMQAINGLDIEAAMHESWHIDTFASYGYVKILPSLHKQPDKQLDKDKRLIVLWQVPLILFDILPGACKQLAHMAWKPGYHVLLTQDSIVTSMLAGLVGKITGARVVYIGDGEVSLFAPEHRRAYYSAQQMVAAVSWPLVPLRWLRSAVRAVSWFVFTWLARLSVCFIDHFLLPGEANDALEEGCQHIGIPADRVTRFRHPVDINRYPVLDAASRKQKRLQRGIEAHVAVITLDEQALTDDEMFTALTSIKAALSRLPEERKIRVCIMLMSSTRLRQATRAAITELDLLERCLPWGAISAADRCTLLSISDIFLYTGTVLSGYVMPVLEAMAAGCAVVATDVPKSTAMLLADERGIAVAAYDSKQMRAALLTLLNDAALRTRMGYRAREYIARLHNTDQFKRALLQATCWSGLAELLDALHSARTVEVKK